MNRDPHTEADHPGRLRGGLSHGRSAALGGAEPVIKRWYEALRPQLAPLGWSVAGGLVGAGIGLLAVTLWSR